MFKIELKKLFPLNFTQKKQGFSALLIGVVIAVVLGTLANIFSWGIAWIWWLFSIGVVVGILNIFHDEGVLFILTLLTITFMLNLLAEIAFFPLLAITLFQAVVYLLAPIATIVGLKVLYALAVK